MEVYLGSEFLVQLSLDDFPVTVILYAGGLLVVVSFLLQLKNLIAFKFPRISHYLKAALLDEVDDIADENTIELH